jgi:hypothetical protein
VRKIIVLAAILIPLLASSTLAETPPSAEWKDGRLSVTAEKARLAEILQAIARLTGMEVRGAEALDEEVSVQFSGLALGEALKRLLLHVNHLVLEDTSTEEGGTRLIVWVLGAGGRPPAAAVIERVEKPAPSGDQPWGPIAELVVDPDPGMRRWAVKRLGERADHEAFTRLLRVLEDDDADVRRDALTALAQYGRTAIDPVKRLLEAEKVADVRVAALQLLGQIGREDAAPFLLGVLGDPDPRVRIAAVEALGHAGEPTATEALLEGIRDKEPAVRMAALRTLAFYVGERAARDAIEQGLIDKQEAVRALGSGLVESLGSRGSAGGGSAAPPVPERVP